MKENIHEKIEGMFNKYIIAELISVCALALLNVTDGICVAQKVGDAGMAAVNLAWPIAAFGLALAKGIGRGASVIMSNERGKGNEENVKTFKGNAITLLFLFSIIFTILLLFFYKDVVVLFGARDSVYTEACTYAKYLLLGGIVMYLGEGLHPILNNSFKVKESTIFYSLTCALNIVGDIVLVLFCDMGVKGAAIATSWSEIIMATGGLIVVLRDKRDDLKLRHYMLKWKNMIRILKNAISPFGLAFADSFEVPFYMVLTYQYGGIPAQAMYGAIAYLHTIIGSLFIGVADGVQPLLSMANGYKDEDLLKKLMRKSLKTLVIITIISTWAFFIVNKNLKLIYNLSNEAMQFAAAAMLLRALAMPIYGLVKLYISYNNSVFRVKTASLLVYLEALVITPLFVMTLPLKYGINGVWATCLVSQSFMLALALLLYKGKDIDFISYRNKRVTKLKLLYSNASMRFGKK